MLSVSGLGTGGLCCPALITAVGMLGRKRIAGTDCQTWGSRGRALETEQSSWEGKLDWQRRVIVCPGVAQVLVPVVCSRRAQLVSTAGGQEWLSLLEAGLLSPGSFLRARQSPACLCSFVPSCARARAFSPSWQRGAERLPSRLTALPNFSTLFLALPGGFGEGEKPAADSGHRGRRAGVRAAGVRGEASCKVRQRGPPSRALCFLLQVYLPG